MLQDDLTTVSWWICQNDNKGERVYQLNGQTFFTHRQFGHCPKAKWYPTRYHAITIRPRPFMHRNMWFSRVTGEQVGFEVVKCQKTKCC